MDTLHTIFDKQVLGMEKKQIDKKLDEVMSGLQEKIGREETTN